MFCVFKFIIKSTIFFLMLEAFFFVPTKCCRCSSGRAAGFSGCLLFVYFMFYSSAETFEDWNEQLDYWAKDPESGWEPWTTPSRDRAWTSWWRKGQICPSSLARSPGGFRLTAHRSGRFCSCAAPCWMRSVSHRTLPGLCLPPAVSWFITTGLIGRLISFILVFLGRKG